MNDKIDKERYEELMGEICAEIHFPLPCYPDEAEQIFKMAWNAQQTEIDLLKQKINDLENGQKELNFQDSVINQKLTTAGDNLIYLNECEKEGIQSGMPSPEDWENAFNEFSQILEAFKS